MFLFQHESHAIRGKTFTPKSSAFLVKLHISANHAPVYVWKGKNEAAIAVHMFEAIEHRNDLNCRKQHVCHHYDESGARSWHPKPLERIGEFYLDL